MDDLDCSPRESVAARNSSRAGGILAIIVTYKVDPATCPSLASLLAAAAALARESCRLCVLVADNTPGGQQVSGLPPGVAYKAYPGNPGLARPYNDALQQAEQEGFDWLLTLDQDTALPVSFLSDMVAVARQYYPDQKVAAVAPRIMDGNRTISPFRFVGGFLPVVLPAGTSGIAGPHTSALNSAALLRVSTLRQLGGYNEQFPLHNSDTALYCRLDANQKRVVVAGGVVVAHELSILDRQNRLLPGRYRQMLQDECAFWDRHMGFAARGERLVRLIVRYLKGIATGEAADFQRVTRSEIWRRLLTRRISRMKTDSVGSTV